MGKIVLVPTDFSDVCYDAICYGAQLAVKLKYSLAVLHVIDKKSDVVLKAEEQLADIGKKISEKYSVEVVPIAKKGNIFTAIGKVAEELGAGIVVLGTHGKVGLQQKISGSYAKKVVTSSPVPVIVIQKGVQFEGFKNIIFPVSENTEVRQKVAWAQMIAEKGKTKVHIFQLYEPLKENQVKVKVIVKQIMKDLEKSGIACAFAEAVKGITFGDQLLDYSVKNKADLVSIMTVSRDITYIFNRYTENMIFNKFKIPVMCVNPIATYSESR